MVYGLTNQCHSYTLAGHGALVIIANNLRLICAMPLDHTTLQRVNLVSGILLISLHSYYAICFHEHLWLVFLLPVYCSIHVQFSASLSELLLLDNLNSRYCQMTNITLQATLVNSSMKGQSSRYKDTTQTQSNMK